MRAYQPETGTILRTYDPQRSFEPVNGVEARGATMAGPGPGVAGGCALATQRSPGRGRAPAEVFAGET
jgi:hypothetical protein